MGAPDDLEYVTLLSSESEQKTISASSFFWQAVGVIWNGIESIRELAKVGASILLLLSAALLAWAYVQAGGFRPMLSLLSQFLAGGCKTFFPVLTANVARAEGMSCERTKKSGIKRLSVDDEIQRSKSHWSQLTEYSDDSDSDEDVVAEESNVEVFKALELHPQWGDFFYTFGYSLGVYASVGELVVGEKFAEGGQAEIYHAHVMWDDEEKNEEDVRNGREWVLKVFKKGTFLRHLQKQWPHSLFRFHAERMERQKLGKPAPMKYKCDVYCGTLLKDGRFAFLMCKELEDLRICIDRLMMTKACHDCGPFPKEIVVPIMYRIAEGMDWLHSHNIVHRDLKASNVLYTQVINKDWEGHCFVADFECSIGVVGTGFFRAPEILQALKGKGVNKRQSLFTKAADVYSYGMTCYEILTGKLPFENQPWNDYDIVLKGKRPKVPKFVDEWIHDLLSRCWHFDPAARPTFGEILNILETKSAVVKDYAERTKRFIEELEGQSEGYSPSLC